MKKSHIQGRPNVVMIQFSMQVPLSTERPIFVVLICFKADRICHDNTADTITVRFVCLQITVFALNGINIALLM